MRVRDCGWCGERVEGGDHSLCVEALITLAKEHEQAATDVWLQVGRVVAARLEQAPAA